MKLQRKAYSEVYALLQLMSLDLKNKIPNNVLKSIDNKRDKRYEIKIDDFANYEFSEDANFLLGVLYKNYFASDEEKKIIDAKIRIMKKRNMNY